MAIDLAKVQWDAPPKIDMAKIQWDEAPAQYGAEVPSAKPTYSDAIPVSRMESFGRGIAGLADTTLGGIAPGIIGPVTYAGSRAFGATPEQATASSQAAAAPFEKPFGKMFGVAETPEYKGEASQQLTDFIGKNVQKGSKWISEQTGLPEADVENMLGTALMAAPGAVKKSYQAAAPVVKQGIEAIPSVKAAREARIAKSYERGVDIDTTKLANQYGIDLNVAEKNPTAGSKLGQAFVGAEDLNNRLSIGNQPKWVDISKEALGVSKETPLTSPAVFDQARSQPKFAEPYNKINAVKEIDIPDSAFNKLEEAKSKATFNDPGDATIVSNYIDNLKTELAQGGDGSKLLKSVQDLRQQAQSVYNAEKAGTAPPQGAKARADAQMAAANVLDDIIYHNLPDAASKKAFLPARAAMADSYAIQAATDFGTGLVDPNVFAKMVKEKGDYMTGVAGDMGRIAANNPNVTKINAQYQPTTVQQFKRNSPGALLGAAIGGVSGLGAEGVIGGAAIGGGINEMARRLYAKRMTSPEFQRANVIPPDYRNRLNPAMFNEQPVNMLRPVEPGQSNIVPFDQRNNPNFVIPTNETLRMPIDQNRPDLRQAMPAGQQPAPANALRLGMDQAPEVTARLRAEDARRARMAQMAEAETAATEAQQRAPTRGGTVYEVDPVSGKLVPASQGIKGATPETFQDYTATLKSATNKISSGQRFSLDAAEKVAWDKTRVDLAEVMPGFKALDDKAIANKMMDRQWVQEAVNTAKSKATAFEEIAARAQDQQAIFRANAERQRMLDVADMMEANLSQLRAKEGARVKLQGPKTRAAKRNALSPENRNNLREE